MKAFITGVTGQDGSYLLELLLDKGYEVHAIIRRSSVFTTNRIPEKYWKHKNFKSYHGDLTDSSTLHNLISKIKPDEVYNLAAQSHVGVSFDVPEYTGEVDAIGTIRLLDAIRNNGKKTKFYQASTSELFGGLPGTEPQDETTQFYPKSPYGAAKLYGHWVTVNYREAHGMFACNGILFNHESPRRGETFVTRKITRAFAEMAFGRQETLYLGNLQAKRDWGHAKDYVAMQWLMLQQKDPDDYVIATGQEYSVKDFILSCASKLRLEVEFVGIGLTEKCVVRGLDKEICPGMEIGQVIVKVDPTYFRPSEVEELLGSSKKARDKLGWRPKVSFDSLVSEMVQHDYNAVKDRN